MRDREAAMSAAHHKLDNMTAIVDRNHLQIDGRTDQVMNLDPLAKKWESFGWNVISCNGNDIADLLKAFNTVKDHKNQPSVIIAETKMGKGVESIEDDYKWHGKAPSTKEMKLFIDEINSL